MTVARARAFVTGLAALFGASCASSGEPAHRGSTGDGAGTGALASGAGGVPSGGASSGGASGATSAGASGMSMSASGAGGQSGSANAGAGMGGTSSSASGSSGTTSGGALNGGAGAAGTAGQSMQAGAAGASAGAAGMAGMPMTSGEPKILLVAGSGTGDDGSPATSAAVLNPYGTAVDPVSGDIYISECDTGKIRHVDAGGTITTVVGPGAPGAAGSIKLSQPHDLLFQPGTQNLFIADTMNGNVYRLNAATGEVAIFVGAGTPFAKLSIIYCLAFSPSGNELYYTGPDDIRVIDLGATTAKTAVPLPGRTRHRDRLEGDAVCREEPPKRGCASGRQGDWHDHGHACDRQRGE
ncbi:MAG TPA: hypothetical protein VFV94_04445 [Polyangiaceae bacterium]|nr:hypothetical protein [Polyangiaceae bacterium]